MMRLRFGLLCSIAAIAWGASPIAIRAADPAVLAAERERIDMIERVAPSVVAIFAASGDGGGSGVLISPDGFAIRPRIPAS